MNKMCLYATWKHTHTWMFILYERRHIITRKKYWKKKYITVFNIIENITCFSIQDICLLLQFNMYPYEILHCFLRWQLYVTESTMKYYILMRQQQNNDCNLLLLLLQLISFYKYDHHKKSLPSSFSAFSFTRMRKM